jgi:hypothetical protein
LSLKAVSRGSLERSRLLTHGARFLARAVVHKDGGCDGHHREHETRLLRVLNRGELRPKIQESCETRDNDRGPNQQKPLVPAAWG